VATGIISCVAPLTAEAAAGSVVQTATAVVNGPSALAMSGMASCTGGGTDTIQTVAVSQGLTVGAVNTASNAFPCDGNMYPWGIVEGTTLGSWAGGSNVTSVVAFTSSPLTTTNLATLTPAAGTTLFMPNGGGIVDNTTAYVSGTATCTDGGTKTIQIDYNEYDAGISGSGDVAVDCDGSAHSWGTLLYASGGDWSGENGMAVVTMQNGSSQTIATYTTSLSLAS